MYLCVGNIVSPLSVRLHSDSSTQNESLPPYDSNRRVSGTAKHFYLDTLNRPDPVFAEGVIH